jgi:hypothetical protein
MKLFCRPLILIAALFASSTAIAQTQCLPGGVCCIYQDCGTLEQFRRRAEILCLQADAVENKNTAQAIRLVGVCGAAKIAAQRVEQAQIANQADHQRALEARRKLREMGVKGY